MTPASISRAAAIRTLSFFWSVLSAVERARLDFLSSLFVPLRLNFPVWSIGNLQAGGSGKTPLTAHLLRAAFNRGLRPLVLSRSYRSEWEKSQSGGFLWPGQPRPLATVCGDEAALLHDLFPELTLALGANRVQQVQNVLQKLAGQQPFDLLFLEDAFQYHRIEKDKEILLMTSYSPWQIPYRDFLKTAERADLIIWTKGKKRPPTFGRPWVRVQFYLPLEQRGEGVLPLWLIAGVADFLGLKQTLQSSGVHVVRELALSDHTPYQLAQVQAWLFEAKQAELQIGLTGKDWVKWKDLGVDSRQVRIFEPEPIFLESGDGGEKLWKELLWS